VIKRILVFAAIASCFLQWAPAIRAQGSERIEYFTDSILQKEDEYIRLLGGSSWVLSTFSTALVTDDVIIVFRDITYQGQKVKMATAYVDGDEIPVRHVRGTYATSTGYLTTVVEALGDGAVLRLADGTLLSVPSYDRYDTGWWLPPYRALLTSNRSYLYNLKNGKRVWVNPLK
jgi:hypothetical protein